MKRTIFVLVLIAFLDASGFGLVFPLFASMLFDLDCSLLSPEASDTVRGIWLGILLSTAPLTQMLVSPFLGSLSDRIGRRPLILSCLLFGTVAYLFAAYAVHVESLIGLFLSRVCIGIPFATFGLANAAISDISTDEEKGRGFAWINSAYGSGFAIGPLLGGVLAGDLLFAQESFVRPFVISSILLGIAVLFVIYWLPETRRFSEEKEEKSSLLQELRGADSKVIFLLLGTLFFSFGWVFYIEMVPVWWMSRYDLDPCEIGILFGFGSFWLVLTSTFIAGPLIRRVQPLVLFEVLALFLCLSIWIVFMLDSPTAYLCEIAVQNMIAGLLFPVTAVAVSNTSSAEHQGKTMGIYAAAEGFGFGLSPVSSGLFIGLHLMSPIALGGFFILLAFIFAHIVRKRESLTLVQGKVE
jgi:DHA1 family tetracycline resistance protein-like MFS transporter